MPLSTYAAVCGKRATLPGDADENSPDGRNRALGWNVKRQAIRAWGESSYSGLGGIPLPSNWIDGRPSGPLSKAPQRKRPCRSRALPVDPLI